MQHRLVNWEARGTTGYFSAMNGGVFKDIEKPEADLWAVADHLALPQFVRYVCIFHRRMGRGPSPAIKDHLTIRFFHLPISRLQGAQPTQAAHLANG